jgi:heptose-I-phosphate ethanolaminephosphotransferase
LPVLDDVLKKVSSPTLIIIHLYGCHGDYFARYPKTFAKFDNLTDGINQNLQNYAANIVNQYDNAMLYSDMIISQIIKKTENTGKSAFVVFFSDHGEPVYEDGKTAFRSIGVANRYMYDIPLVVWLSSEYKKLFPEFSASLKATTERSYQMDSFMYAILELMQITYNGFPAENSLFNQRFMPRERIIARQNYDVLFPHVPKPLFPNNNSSSALIHNEKSGNKI